MRYFVLDTETHLIEPGNIIPKIVCMQYEFLEAALNPLCEVGIAQGDRIEQVLESYVFSDPEVVVSGHNIAFDWAVILRRFPRLAPKVWKLYDEGRVWDTRYWEQLYRNAEGTLAKFRYGLDKLYNRVTGQELAGKSGDTWRLKYGTLDGIPWVDWPQEAVDYAQMDVVATATVLQHQLKEGDVPPTFFDQVRAAWAIHLMAAWGLRTHPGRVAAYEAKLDAVVAERRAFLAEQGLLREDGTKDMGAVRALVTEAYDGSPPKTAKGAVQTTRRVLKESGHAVLEKMAEGGEFETYRNTFLPTLKQGLEHAICAHFTVLKETGRTSCSKPNLQNLPADDELRSCFVPRPGWVYVGADYGVIELACFAQVLYMMQGYSKLRDALVRGDDPHIRTAAGIEGVEYEDLLVRYKASEPRAKELRKLAKAANFGFLGGLGGRFAEYARGYGINITREEALDIRAKWLDTYPEVRDHFRVVSENARFDDWDFVHPVTGFIRGNVTYTQGANCYVQHLGAHGAKRALYYLVRATKVEPDSPLFGCAVVNFVHDEFILEVPEGRHHDAAKELERLMVEHMRYYLTDVPITAESYAMDAWYKSAEPVYDGNGRLGVWSDGGARFEDGGSQVAAS